ncbi:MAG: type III-A CRISPR-associated protein Cas10/Csm1 [Brevinematia bacterium]
MSEKKAIIIGALLHDIGKFAQRTNVAGTEEVRRHANKDLKYPHSYFTNFILKEILQNREADFDNIVRLSSKHHNPESWDEWIIAEADRLSSGADRQDIDYSIENNSNYLTTPLLSIFSNVNLGKDFSVRPSHYLKPLEPENVFPRNGINVNSNHYKNLWDEFLRNFKSIDFTEKLFISLDSLLERFWWCIPSATQEGGNDISLYDHSVTTTAIASVLYNYHEKNNSLHNVEEIINRAKKKFLFVTGDVSGIQGYIFDLKTTSYNAKILRARSFEIQALCDAVVFEILQRLELPIFCRVMNSGGRFLLLLPNTEKTKGTLKVLRAKLEEYMLRHYFAELALCISDGIEASGEDLMQQNAKELFMKFSYDSGNAKLKKFQNVLTNPKTHILGEEYNKIKDASNVCSLCMCRAISNNDLCNICNELVRFGGNIPKSKFITYSKTKIELSETKLTLPFEWKTYITESDSTENSQDSIIFAVNKYKPGFAFAKIPYYLPAKEDGVKEFAELAEVSKGDKKIAMFKADLDNLGAIFSIGLGDSVSLSRYATLSRMLHYFFSVYVNHSLKNNTEFNDIYTVFSGGDDLCLIGPWNKIIDYSTSIQAKFKEFCGENPNLTISGGIVLSGPKRPVKYIAKNAEENLEESKNNGKNKITIFESHEEWDKFSELIETGKKLDSWLKEEKISSAQLYRILKYHHMNLNAKNGKEISRNLLWHSLLKYDVSRNIQDESLREEVTEIIVKNIDLIRIPVCYAIYLNRKPEN